MMGFSPNLGSGVLAEGVLQMYGQPSWACSGLRISFFFLYCSRQSHHSDFLGVCAVLQQDLLWQPQSKCHANFEGLSPHSVGDLAQEIILHLLLQQFLSRCAN